MDCLLLSFEGKGTDCGSRGLVSPSLDRQKAVVLKRTWKSDILGTEGFISCVVLELLSLTKFQYSSMKSRSTNSTYMFNVIVKVNKAQRSYLGPCTAHSCCALLLNAEM